MIDNVKSSGKMFVSKAFVYLFLTLLCSVYCQDPKVTITHTEPETYLENHLPTVNARRNQDVSLSCFVEDLAPSLQVRWRRVYEVNGQTKRVFISTDMANTDVTKYSIEKPTDYTWRLRIKDIQILDEGTYECFVQLTELSIVKGLRYVKVLVAPSLLPQQVSSDMTVGRDEEVVLMCNATGRPYPMIEWTRLGGAVLPNGKERHLGDTLVIPRVQATHRGEYRCTVWNSVGRLQRKISLDVKFAPIVTVEQTEVYQAPGYGAELQCLAEANPSPGETGMKWTKDGLSYTQTSGKYIVRKVLSAFNRIMFELIIDGVEEEDYGLYTCQIRNSVSTTGTGTTQEVRLIKSKTPVPSRKIGKAVKAGEWRARFQDKSVGGASGVMISMATLLMCLVTFVLHH